MTTALGHFIGICHHSTDGWLCITFDKRGFWKSYAPCKTKADAMKERRRIARYQKTYATKRAAKRAARLAKKST
jgi:hypothetical protein